MQTERQLSRNLSLLGAWAFSIGTSIGWGSLVVTSNTYLAQAGPWGSAFGMILGGLIMVIISFNYAYLMNVYPDAGGAYTYADTVLGHDFGFLTAWFLSLTYLAILWANTTSIPLFARYFIGDVFKFGCMYALFGYEVYLGEVLLSVGALFLVGWLCARRKGAATGAMIALAVVFTVGIAVCAIVALLRHGAAFAPDYVPERSSLSQIVRIAVISPWAFIGFENISHATEETKFSRTLLFRVLLISVISTTVLYILVTLLSATAYPPEYASWLDYIRDHGNLSGIEGLPAFYAARHYLGSAGVTLLMAALLALILTSLIGNISALSRLFYAMGRDRVLPGRFARLNSRSLPGEAICLIVGISALFPFLGRTAIGWIVDVTTIGATLIYGFVSAAAIRLARGRRDHIERWMGRAGLAVMIGFMLYLIVPNLYTVGSMARESYFLFVVWAVVGLLYFRLLLKNDPSHRYGKTIAVWIALFTMILFICLVFLLQTVIDATGEGMRFIERFYTEAQAAGAVAEVVEGQLAQVRRVIASSVTTVVALITLSLVVLILNFRLISERAQTSEMQLGMARELANRDPLTGVKSRHAFLEKEREVDELIAGGQAGAFGIVVCDLNGLKFINDALGHKAGDERIKQASKVICDLFNHSPVYRNGGDEFVVYLSGQDYENRQALLEALHDKSVENIPTGEVVISAGLSEYGPGADPRLRPVFERADAAMYREKMLLKSMGAATR